MSPIWHRKPPTVVCVVIEKNYIIFPLIFLSGWLTKNGRATSVYPPLPVWDHLPQEAGKSIIGGLRWNLEVSFIICGWTDIHPSQGNGYRVHLIKLKHKHIPNVNTVEITVSSDVFGNKVIHHLLVCTQCTPITEWQISRCLTLIYCQECQHLVN